MSLSVLVVDDSTVARRMIIKVLRMSGAPVGNVVQATNGLEGLEAMEDNLIDLVLADIHMPVMNGEEMIDKIRENPNWRDMHIIVISTESSESRIKRLEDKGARFVHKPYSPVAIREAITEAAKSL